MKKTFCLLALATLIAVPALAYLPPYWMIASRVVDNHGNGFYKLDMDVVFNHGTEPKIVNERWFVLDGNNMRVEIRSKKGFANDFKLTYVYANNKKYFLDEKGRGKSATPSQKFFEHFFHHRKSSEFKSDLVKAGLVSAATLKSAPKTFNPKSLEKPAEGQPIEPTPAPTNDLVDLGRVGGTVSYKISANDTEDSPAIWIEQDQFVITKIVFGNGIYLTAEDYDKASSGLHFPKNREVLWEDNKAHIHLNSINSISKSASNRKLVSPGSIKPEEKMPSEGDLLTDPVIRGFYSQFR